MSIRLFDFFYVLSSADGGFTPADGCAGTSCPCLAFVKAPPPSEYKTTVFSALLAYRFFSL